jgi:hypothetical protein
MGGESLRATGELMRCSKCGSDTPTGKKFCGDCGAPLENRCAKCGADNPSGKRFCGDCGAAFTAPAAAAVAAPPLVPASGERWHLTVLFCDLVGSTEIAAQLDPEEWRDVVASYHRAAAEATTRFGGMSPSTSATASWHISAGLKPTIMTANVPQAPVSRF